MGDVTGSKVAVLGAGSWGTAFSIVLADAGNDVSIWARRDEVAAAINEKHENVDYLPGIELPRNTDDQALSPVLGGRTFAAADADARAAAIAALQVGDLVYIPGHVMLVIGHVDGAPYVIHDTAAIQLGQGDRHVRVPINGVAVTPLLPLMFDRSSSGVDRITAN